MRGGGPDGAADAATDATSDADRQHGPITVRVPPPAALEGDAGRAIRDALQRALRRQRQRPGAEVIVRLAPGERYRIGRRMDHWNSFALVNAHDVVFDGNGSTLAIHPSNNAFYLHGCRNCTFRHMTLTLSRRMFAQGEIESIGPESATLTVDAGFPLREVAPDDLQHISIGKRSPRSMTAVVFRSEGHFTSEWSFPAPVAERHFPIAAVQVIRRDERQLVIEPYAPESPAFEQLRARHEQGEAQKIAFMYPIVDREKNRAMDEATGGAWPYRQSHRLERGDPTNFITIKQSADVRFENVRLLQMRRGLFVGDNEGPIRFHRLFVVRRKNEHGIVNLLSSGSDAFMIRNNEVGVHVTNSRFNGLLDDAFNFSVNPYLVRDFDPESLEAELIGGHWMGQRVESGDRLYGYDPVSGTHVGNSRIAEVLEQDVDRGRATVRLDSPIGSEVNQVESNTTAEFESATRMFDLSRANAGYRIENCHFAMNMRNALLSRSPDGAFVGNLVTRTGRSVSFGNNENPTVGVGAIPSDVEVRDNVFFEVLSEPIKSYVYATGEGVADPLIRGLNLEDNRIVRPAGRALWMRRTRGLTLRDMEIVLDTADDRGLDTLVDIEDDAVPVSDHIALERESIEAIRQRGAAWVETFYDENF